MAQAGTATLCGRCETYAATLECEQCDGALCESCSTYIHSKGMFRLHHVTAIGERRVRKCSEHGKELDLFCTVCDEIVCSECLLIGEHRQHSCVSLQNAGVTAKKALDSAVEELKVTRTGVNDAREVLVDTIPRVHKEYDAALLGIIEAFSRVRAAIDERETAVRNQLYHVREVKVHLLARQIDALEETLGAADESMRAAERLLGRKDDYEVVQMRPAVASRLTTLARAGHELEPKADSTFLYTFQAETEEAAKAYGYVDVSVLDEDIDPAVLRRIQTDLAHRESDEAADESTQQQQQQQGAQQQGAQQQGAQQQVAQQQQQQQQPVQVASVQQGQRMVLNNSQFARATPGYFGFQQ